MLGCHAVGTWKGTLRMNTGPICCKTCVDKDHLKILSHQSSCACDASESVRCNMFCRFYGALPQGALPNLFPYHTMINTQALGSSHFNNVLDKDAVLVSSGLMPTPLRLKCTRYHQKILLAQKTAPVKGRTRQYMLQSGRRWQIRVGIRVHFLKYIYIYIS